ncbi:MAG: PrsW family intramembrane metalloprotease [Minisyncoccales bacterium]
MLIYCLYIFLGILPTLLWLLFYLRKDSHPEPKLMVLKIFFCGFLMALPAILLETGLFNIFNLLAKIKIPSLVILLLNFFISVAFVEEILKYFVVRLMVLKDPEFDEPVDAVIYMIIAALGFAAAENILILASLGANLFWPAFLSLTFLRFWGAIFLHGLSSGLLGYFLALAFFQIKKRKRYLITGLSLAVLLHGLFNLFIMKIDENNFYLIANILILSGLALFLSFTFKRLKKLKSVCQI